MTELTIKYSTSPELDKPMVDIQVTYNDHSRSFRCLLDSGADLITLPMSASKDVYGINLEEMEDSFLKRISDTLNAEIKTTECICGHQLPSIQLPAQFQVIGSDYPKIWAMINWVKSDYGKEVMPVAGRKSFFSFFKVIIEESKKEFTLVPNVDKIDESGIMIPESFRNLVGTLLLKAG